MKYTVDIDNTLIYTDYEKGRYFYTSKNKELIKTLNKLYDDGHLIVLWTGRHWNHLDDTLIQLKECGIKYHTLLMGKPPADYYIDDKSVKPDEFLEEIRRK